jgi:hypothetical protein
MDQNEAFPRAGPRTNAPAYCFRSCSTLSYQHCFHRATAQIYKPAVQQWIYIWYDYWISKSTQTSLTYPKQSLPQPEYVDDVDLTRISHAWEALSGDPGIGALSDDFVAAKHLPTAMRYPWDDSKSVYLLQGFNDLHCFVSRHEDLLMLMPLI